MLASCAGVEYSTAAKMCPPRPNELFAVPPQGLSEIRLVCEVFTRGFTSVSTVFRAFEYCLKFGCFYGFLEVFRMVLARIGVPPQGFSETRLRASISAWIPFPNLLRPPSESGATIFGDSPVSSQCSFDSGPRIYRGRNNKWTPFCIDLVFRHSIGTSECNY